jgi:hypothetical protein
MVLGLHWNYWVMIFSFVLFIGVAVWTEWMIARDKRPPKDSNVIDVKWRDVTPQRKRIK